MYFQKMVEKLGHKNENLVAMMTKFPSIRPSFPILETWSFSEVPLLFDHYNSDLPAMFMVPIYEKLYEQLP